MCRGVSVSDETRLATHYGKGRLFLVGDAAHIRAPMGGRD
nr:FAD-dependent monooxygenase [Pararhodobacter zhoushanensis]